MRNLWSLVVLWFLSFLEFFFLGRIGQYLDYVLRSISNIGWTFSRILFCLILLSICIVLIFYGSKVIYFASEKSYPSEGGARYYVVGVIFLLLLLLGVAARFGSTEIPFLPFSFFGLYGLNLIFWNRTKRIGKIDGKLQNK